MILNRTSKCVYTYVFQTVCQTIVQTTVQNITVFPIIGDIGSYPVTNLFNAISLYYVSYRTPIIIITPYTDKRLCLV